MPLRSPPCLQGDNGVDGRTVRFLLKQVLQKKEEEKEAKEQEEKETRDGFFLSSVLGWTVDTCF